MRKPHAYGITVRCFSAWDQGLRIVGVCLVVGAPVYQVFVTDAHAWPPWATVLVGLGLLLIAAVERLGSIFVELRDITWTIDAILKGTEEHEEVGEGYAPWPGIERLRHLLGLGSLLRTLKK